MPREALSLATAGSTVAWIGVDTPGHRALRSATQLHTAGSAAATCGGRLMAAVGAETSNGTSLQTSVATTCVSGGLDIFTYLLVSLSLIMLVCVGIACGQRCYYARRVRQGMDDLPGMFAQDYDGGEADAEGRLARVAHRQQALRSLAFPMGSRELHSATSPGSAALTTMGGSSGARKDSLSNSAKRSNPDAAALLLSGPETDGTGPSSLLSSLTRDGDGDGTTTHASEGTGPTIVALPGEGEEHVDPITLDTISSGEQVVEFPGCNHLFRLDSIMQWFETNETCPVCRRQFSATVTATQSAAVTSDDAKAGSE